MQTKDLTYAVIDYHFIESNDLCIKKIYHCNLVAIISYLSKKKKNIFY